MEVLIYQVVIAIIILVAGSFGKKTRNIVTFIICLFTFVEIFTFKLAMLQFITIFLAYSLSSGYEEKKDEAKKEEFNYIADKKKKEKSKSSFGNFSIFFIIAISIFSTVYIFQGRNELKKELIEIKKDTTVYKKGRKLFEPVQETIAVAVDTTSVSAMTFGHTSEFNKRTLFNQGHQDSWIKDNDGNEMRFHKPSVSGYTNSINQMGEVLDFYNLNSEDIVNEESYFPDDIKFDEFSKMYSGLKSGNIYIEKEWRNNEVKVSWICNKKFYCVSIKPL